MAAACPAVDDVPSSPPPPKKPQHMTWAMSLASAYVRIFSALESGRDVLAMPPVGSLRLDCYRQSGMQHRCRDTILFEDIDFFFHTLFI